MSVTKANITAYWRETREPIKQYRNLVKSGDHEKAIEVSLGLVKRTVTLINETKKNRQELGDEYTDIALENLKATLEGRITGIISLANKEDSNYSKSKLTKRIKEVAGAYKLPKRVFKSAALLAEKKQSKSLKAITTQGEDIKTEFKKSFSEKEKIAISLTAFANTKGGSVYIGIAEKKDVMESEQAVDLDEHYSAVGTPRDIDTNSQKLISFLFAHSNLDIKELKVQVIEYKSKNILKITIPALFKSSGEMTFYNNNAYVRDHNFNRKLNSKEVYDAFKLYIEKSIKLTKPTLTYEDIRSIVINEKNGLLEANAFYSNGGTVPGFKGYWYGWQIGGRGLVWTPLGFSESKIKKPVGSRFTEIQVYKYEQEDKNVDPSNTRGVWSPN